METRDEEQGGILVVERLEFVTIDVGFSVPRLLSDPDEDDDLDSRVDDYLTNDTGQDFS